MGSFAGGAVVLAAWLALLPAAALSDDPPPFPEFTFKTVRPPEPGSRKRIDVQIAPQAPGTSRLPQIGAPETPKPAAAAPASGEAPGRYGWFWEAISPERAASGPGRLEPALNALSAPPAGQGVPAPRLSSLMEIARAHGAQMLINSVGTQVSPALILAVIAVESSGDASAVSGAGAQGLMQLMPDTAARYGVSDPFDAGQSIAGGTAFLDVLLTRFEGDPILALAGYNAGETQLALHDGVPEFAETRDYVPKVLAAFAVARGLCVTPPELISDGCVFRLP
ncbi:Soluble lytic murein transglycosylase [Pseudooceanicola antarcticus]|uniref:Lytic transglycosylase domain-containing protein n=1 Tax=Pseudooceanicola antarcticus TaxID=1247613 RepID=A0A285ISR9_9RHOB|nr:lytic transglycosylase domain-containing protein [Pseudooceanicola antarcticus]PJE31965.1 lytic transglycosylase domain-containing protein [Pseudooceanicola antarcticus]SNY51042.1 Soluble lytic murein transglycosylase [Pseudooceanicola antarcticus]